MDANKDPQPKPAPEPIDDVVAAPTEKPATATDQMAGAIATNTVEAEAGESENPMAIPEKPQSSHHQTSKGPIVVALAIAILLAVLAVMVFIKTNKADAPPENVNNTQKSDSTTTPATTSDIDQTSSDIDESLKAIDETDFNENDLSDSTLGL